MPPVASTSSPRTHVGLGPERISNVASNDFPGRYVGEDAAWDIEKLRDGLRVSVNRVTDDKIEFDLVGVDASIANAFRRILMAEVPTIAIEKVYIWINTSIVQDEVLAQRLGLVPIAVNPRLLRDRNLDPDALPTDRDTVVFRLQTKCTRVKDADPGERDPLKLYKNAHVTSGQLTFLSKGNQAEMFGDSPPRVVNPDILLAKMRPGQHMRMELFAQKGIGKEHAKWSAVATASYRLMPSIDILNPIPDELCERFAQCFAPGVIEIDGKASKRNRTARVANPRLDTVSREVLRHDEFKDRVALGRQRDHFIFSVESAGQYPPEELFVEAGRVLLGKIDVARRSLLALLDQFSNDL